MPRFFFDIEASEATVDRIGVELPDREAARMHAMDLACDHLTHQARADAALKVRIAIRNEAGEVWDTLLSTAV